MSISSHTAFQRAIKSKPGDFIIVHYACESLYDNEKGLSPRVTAIIAQHYATEQTISFAFHETAEVLGFPKEAISENLDAVEKALLQRFNEFVQEHRNKFWIHWNMRNILYGFELIEHRYRVLTGENMSTVPIESRINLNEIIKSRYGEGYVADPKLYNLMRLNGGEPKLLLNGKDEVVAFQAGEYLKMHNSALAKISFLSRLVHRMIEGRLVTTSKGIGQRIDKLFDSRVSRFVALAVSSIGAVASIVAIVQLFQNPS